jgi:hypothetical protein
MQAPVDYPVLLEFYGPTFFLMTQSDPRFSEAMAGKVGHESEITQKSSPEKDQGQGLIQGILTEREEGSVWLPSIVPTSLNHLLFILKI